MSRRIIHTACPRNCYSTCALRITVEEGRLRRIEPLRTQEATAAGPCLKGLSYLERVYSPDRILTPLRRVAGTHSFRPIPWDQALDLIAGKLERLRATHGPKSLLYYTASGTKGLLNGVGAAFWRLYGGCTTTYGDLCWPAGLEATRLTLGANEQNAPWDLANARVIVLWGKNAAETNIHQMQYVNDALGRGGRLVVIDPRRTETAERASLLIQPRPGTDGAIALSVGHLLIRNGWIDREFISRHVHGFDAYAGLVASCTPAWGAEIAGIPERQIDMLAEVIGRSGPVSITAGFGMQRYANSGQTIRSLIALLAITGNIGKRGAGWGFANLRTQLFGEKDPIAFYPPAVPDPLIRVSIPTARLGEGIMAATDPPVTMAWVERGNPIPQNPETPAVLRAFRGLEFRVVVEEVLTDTAREADIVLPAKTFFEQTDVIGAYWHDYLQLRERAIEPPGEVKPETEIYRLLAARLGIAPELIAEAIPESGDQEIERWLDARLAHLPGITVARLREGPVRVPDAGEIAFADLAFQTPSRKVELDSAEARQRWGVDGVPSYAEPAESTRRSGEGGEQRYRLNLLTPNTKNRIHSQFGNLASIRAVEPAPLLAINPADAHPRGIRAGMRVRLFNDRGELFLASRFDHGVRPGCVVLHNGWWLTDGAAVNVLSKGRETDMGHGAAFHENLVEVAPA